MNMLFEYAPSAIHPLAGGMRDWQRIRQQVPIHRRMLFTEAGLVLGASTVLAGMRSDHFNRPCLKLAGNEARVLALLDIAYPTLIESWVLETIAEAASFWRRGEQTMASLQLAYCGLKKLPPGDEVPRRLFFAEGLLDAGLPPERLVYVMAIDQEQNKT